MSTNFTKYLLLLLIGLSAWCTGLAQYTATTVNTDGWQTALAKDAEDNIYAIRVVSDVYT